MCYAIRFLDVKSFIAKILEKNEPSINLFSSLYFREKKRVHGVPQLSETLQLASIVRIFPLKNPSPSQSSQANSYLVQTCRHSL